MSKVKVYSSIVVPFAAIVIAAYTLSGVSVAQEGQIDSQAAVSVRIGATTVNREEVLREFFSRYNSPFVEHVEVFIEVADAYGLDYRLLPAISCMESTCGQKIIEGSYNAWGWGIYGNNAIYFENFEDGIRKVGKGIYEGYASKGLTTPRLMAPIYTPPKAHHWLSGVTFFFDQMDEVSKQLETTSV